MKVVLQSKQFARAETMCDFLTENKYKITIQQIVYEGDGWYRVFFWCSGDETRCCVSGRN